MRDWTKAMAALLAAVSTVGFVQIISAQDTATTPAVRADEADDPFAAGAAEPVAAPSAGRDLSKGELQVSDVGTVDLSVSDANLLDVLRTLALQTKKNIITSKSVGGKVSATLYDVTVREALDAILHANGFAYREKGNFIYVYTIDELKKIQKDERVMRTEIFKLNYTPAAVALEMIKPALSGEAQTAVTKAAVAGLPSGISDVGGNSHALEDAVVVSDYEANIEQVRRMLKELDRRPQQILIEATILSAELTDNNSLGIDFSILGGVDFASIGTTNTALLASNAQGVDTGTYNPVTGSADVDPKTPSSAFAENGYNAVGSNVKGANVQGLNIGIAYNNIGLFLNALEQVTDTVVLANPKVLTLNKQPGSVIVGRKDGYYTTTVTSTTATQSVEYLETGTRLLFRPFIADDGYIRMEIHPEDSDGQVVGGLPRKTTTEITSNVMVKDGHTIIIGGLFREQSRVDKTQVPLLGDIPLAGYLFRSQSDSSRRQEVIIMITPHIIKDNERYAEASAEMMKYADMLRVGIRKGMMPWSRDRLAEMSYQKARDEMSQKFYDRDRAMWYLDCATNLSPLFSEALAAKQRISGEMLMESDNSSIRHFLQNLVLAEQAATVVEPIAEPVETPVPTEPSMPDVVVPVLPVVPETEVPAEPVTPVVPAPEEPSVPEVVAPVEPVTPDAPAADEPVAPEAPAPVTEPAVVEPEAAAPAAVEEPAPAVEAAEPVVTTAAE